MSDKIITTTFQHLRQRLKHQAKRWLHSEDDASDVLQEAFVRLWTSYRHIDNPREVEALSIRIVRNACADMLRQRPSLVPLNETDNIAEERSDRAIREKALNEVEQLISQRLSPLQRHILELHEYDGLSVKAIARRLNKQEAAVRMNLSRARKTLREIMKPGNSHNNDNE